MRAWVALTLAGLLAGCLGPAEGPADAPPSSADPAPVIEPGLVLRGCERHYTFTLVPESVARPFVPDEFAVAAWVTHAQAMVAVTPCAEVAAADGRSFGPAQLVQVSLRIGNVPEGLAGPGLTWYRVLELTDNPQLLEYMVAQDIPVRAARFVREDLGTPASFRLEVSSDDEALLTLVQQSDAGAVPSGTETEDDRVLTKQGDGYAWTQNNATVRRGYAGAGQVVPQGGEALSLFAGAATAFTIPGAFDEGFVTFGRT